MSARKRTPMAMTWDCEPPCEGYEFPKQPDNSGLYLVQFSAREWLAFREDYGRNDVACAIVSDRTARRLMAEGRARW